MYAHKRLVTFFLLSRDETKRRSFLTSPLIYDEIMNFLFQCTT